MNYIYKRRYGCELDVIGSEKELTQLGGSRMGQRMAKEEIEMSRRLIEMGEVKIVWD